MLQIASVLFGLMTMILPFVTPDPSPAPLEGKKVVVGKEGVTLYPRFNKSLKPLSELEEGRILIVQIGVHQLWGGGSTYCNRSQERQITQEALPERQ